MSARPARRGTGARGRGPAAYGTGYRRRAAQGT
jgi:hypothetical protein